MDANGDRPTKCPTLDTPGATGVYLTSEGKKGGAGMGNARALVHSHRQQRRQDTVTIAILDHPAIQTIRLTGMRAAMGSLRPIR